MERKAIPNHKGEKPAKMVFPITTYYLTQEELENYRQLKPPKKPSGLSLIEIRPGSSELTQRGLERKRRKVKA